MKDPEMVKLSFKNNGAYLSFTFEKINSQLFLSSIKQTLQIIWKSAEITLHNYLSVKDV